MAQFACSSHPLSSPIQSLLYQHGAFALFRLLCSRSVMAYDAPVYLCGFEGCSSKPTVYSIATCLASTADTAATPPCCIAGTQLAAHGKPLWWQQPSLCWPGARPCPRRWRVCIWSGAAVTPARSGTLQHCPRGRRWALPGQTGCCPIASGSNAGRAAIRHHRWLRHR
jgi:hypothetical protein